ncbi:MAG: DUF3822 family protein [Bacteroidota bacterium]
MENKTLESYNLTNTIDRSNKLLLSVQFELNGFSFCVVDIDNSKVVLAEIINTNTLSYSDNIVELNNVLKAYEFNKNSFVEIIFSIFSRQLLVVPDEYYGKDMTDKLLNFSFSNIVNSKNLSEHSEHYSTYFLYTVDADFLNELATNFLPEPIFCNSTKKLIDNIYKDFTICDLSKTIFVNFLSKDIEIIVLNYKTLVYYNNFQYSQAEDVLYYLALVAKNVNLSLADVELVFYGNIRKEDSSVNYLNKFVRSISFSNNCQETCLISLPLNLQHQFYNLLHS